ncbi:MAG TPA: hypothetical protein VHT25_13720 [Solirubrobacteraceae bacterium]|jgi:hypothetical protein|nr:hypothetical protein [Solirubrobacteraceae bacterium]
MRNRRRHTADAVERLRLAIDCMPVATREAMLAGVRGNERVIAGAYVDRNGGVCPMLAAHREGARTDFISFARTWDRFTRAERDSRPATERELRILVTQLEDSLCDADGLGLDEAIKQHRALRSRRLLAHGMRRTQSADAASSLAKRSRLSESADPAGAIRARRLRFPRLRREAQVPAPETRETAALAASHA